MLFGDATHYQCANPSKIAWDEAHAIGKMDEVWEARMLNGLVLVSIGTGVAATVALTRQPLFETYQKVATGSNGIDRLMYNLS